MNDNNMTVDIVSHIINKDEKNHSTVDAHSKNKTNNNNKKSLAYSSISIYGIRFYAENNIQSEMLEEYIITEFMNYIFPCTYICVSCPSLHLSTSERFIKQPPDDLLVLEHSSI